MNNKRNERICQVNEKTLIVGVDIAKRKHYARFFDWRGVELCKGMPFANDREGFENFVWQLEKLFRSNRIEKVLIGIEPTGQYCECFRNFFSDFKRVEIVYVSALNVKRSREMDDNMPTKSDPKDAMTIGLLVMQGRFLRCYERPEEYEYLRSLVLLHEKTVKEINRLHNRIWQWIDQYFPEFEEVFKSCYGKKAQIILIHCPFPTEICTLGEDQICELWLREGYRRREKQIAKRLVDAAKDSIGIRRAQEAHRLELQLLMDDFIRQQERKQLLETKMREAGNQISAMENVLSVQGIGVIGACYILAECGDLTRFSCAKQLIKYAGFGLKQRSSGQHKGQTHISKRGRPRLRKILYILAVSLASQKNELSNVYRYYVERSENPLKKPQALVALACRLLRIVHALVCKNTLYDSNMVCVPHQSAA